MLLEKWQSIWSPTCPQITVLLSSVMDTLHSTGTKQALTSLVLCLSFQSSSMLYGTIQIGNGALHGIGGAVKRDADLYIQ